MAVAIRGTTPTTNIVSGTNPISVTCTGSKQPQAGDVLLIFAANNFYAATNITTPTVGGSTTGVTAVTNGAADGGSNLAHIKTYVYVVASTGDLTVSETETGTTDEEKSLIVYVLSGVDTSTPIDTADNATGATSASQVAPSISPSTSDAFLICTASTGVSGGASYTPPSGMTEDCDLALPGFMQATSASLQLSASGSTGTKTFTANISNPWAAISVAIRTASAAAPADPGTSETLAAPGFNSPNGIFQNIPPIDTPPGVNGSAENTTHDVVTGDVGATLTTTDGTNPQHTHVTGAPSYGIGVTDTNPDNTHTTQQPTTALNNSDSTAPAITHTSGDTTPTLAINDSTAPALTHQTFDATTSTAVLVNVNAELTQHTVVAGDPSTTITITAELTNHAQIAGDPLAGVGASAGAGATSHTTGDALASVGGTDGTNPQHTFAAGDTSESIAINAGDAANQHQALDPTVSTAVILNVNAPATDNQHITATPTVEIDVPAGAPATTHQTFDAVGSTTISVTDVTAPANTHTTPNTTAGVGAQPTSALHSFTTSDIVATMGAPIGAPSIAHNAFDAIVTTSLAPPAFVSVEASSTTDALDSGQTRISTRDGRTSVSGLLG